MSERLLAIITALEDMDADGTMWDDDTTWEQVARRIEERLSAPVGSEERPGEDHG